jgi:hypothetical protein
LFSDGLRPRCPASFPVIWLAASFSIVFVEISSLNLSPASSASHFTVNKSCNAISCDACSFLNADTYPFNKALSASE